MIMCLISGLRCFYENKQISIFSEFMINFTFDGVDVRFQMLSPSDKYYSNEIELRPLNAPRATLQMTVGEVLSIYQNTSTLKVCLMVQKMR